MIEGGPPRRYHRPDAHFSGLRGRAAAVLRALPAAGGPGPGPTDGCVRRAGGRCDRPLLERGTRSDRRMVAGGGHVVRGDLRGPAGTQGRTTVAASGADGRGGPPGRGPAGPPVRPEP